MAEITIRKNSENVDISISGGKITYIQLYHELIDIKEYDLDVHLETDDGWTQYIGPVVYMYSGIIVAGIGALSAVISSIILFLSKREGRKIVLKGKSGRTVEFPYSKIEDIDLFIKKAKELDDDEIKIEF